jgi:NADH-quinone oxidoreductase subunit L
MPKRAVGLIGCLSIAGAFGISLWAFLELFNSTAAKPEFAQTLFSWIATGNFSVDFSILVDPLSALMLLVITGVGFLIHVYSIGYMSHDEDYSRYFAWLNLFTFSMLVLVLASNFLLLFVGWELVGLCSYFLIGFWFTKNSAALAAKKAFVVNRIGDFGFMLGIFLIFALFGTLAYGDVFHDANGVLTEGLATAIALLLFVGAIGKSAQIPLYVWLPDAMEGPTPVSALIHAATMVTAGVYMIARTHVIFEMAPTALLVVAIVGALTALLAAAIALVSNDIKRVLAYSTVSQLGYMFLATGVGAYASGMFHLTSHAFMKALLFLGAGSVMHAMSDKTDIREMGGLRKKIPWTWMTFLVGVLAMSGLPPLVGFFSKDLILENVFFSGQTMLWVVGLFTAALTAFYLLRAYFLTFHGKPRYDESKIQPHESPPVMVWPLRILALLSIAGGILWIPFLGFKPLENFLAPVFDHGDNGAHAVEHHGSIFGLELGEVALIVLSVLVALIGIGIAYALYMRNFKPSEGFRKTFKPVYQLFENKFYVDEFYDLVITRPLRAISNFLASTFDQKILDAFINAIGRGINQVGGALRGVQAGYIRSYAAWVLLGTLGIMIYLILR